MTKINLSNDAVLTEIQKPKRGRKPKNANIEKNTQSDVNESSQMSVNIGNLKCEIHEIEHEESEENEENENNSTNNNIDFNLSSETENNQKIVSKKRGRKPKGGKIIQQISILNNTKEVKPNVILHLKCSLKELQTNSYNTCVESFHFPLSKNELNYELISENTNVIQNNYNNEINNNEECQCDSIDGDDVTYTNKESDIKDIWKKLKTLENNLHINNISDKKSACFWCTFDFDNPPVYIPKFYIKDSYSVYGCFCSPECAVAHLMEENIDSSSKFERYYLLNNIYSKIYNYNKNIKPAPNPFYMLDKYYGNLSIQEYRALLRNERLFLIVDKPLTRILPELHEDNDDFIINNKIIPTNKYQIKKKIQKKNQSKNNILSEKFGMN